MVRHEPDDEITMDDGAISGITTKPPFGTIAKDSMARTLNVGGTLVLDQAGYRLDPQGWG